jgi:fatty acid desaturase
LTVYPTATATATRSAASADAGQDQAATTDGEYRELLAQVRAAGLLDRRPARYAGRIAANAVLLAGAVAAFVLIGNSWYQLLVAAGLAVVFTQLGFLGHDAGHRQIVRSRRGNEVLGLLYANLGIGLSYGWWVDKHNRHHSHPNQEERDPDIGTGAFVWTEQQAASTQGVARFVAKHEAALFFPILLLEAANLHVGSLRAMPRAIVRRKLVEASLLLLHLAAYLTVLLLVLSPLRAVAFLVVQQALFGLYLGCAFAPNHKGMPTLTESESMSFLRRQIITSRNVRGGWFVNWALGGLNYQIEHHLFPTMPMPSLRRCQPLVRAFCRQHGLPYCESSLIGSYRSVLRHFAAIGAPLRQGHLAAGG